MYKREAEVLLCVKNPKMGDLLFGHLGQAHTIEMVGGGVSGMEDPNISLVFMFVPFSLPHASG